MPSVPTIVQDGMNPRRWHVLIHGTIAHSHRSLDRAVAEAMYLIDDDLMEEVAARLRTALETSRSRRVAE